MHTINQAHVVRGAGRGTPLGIPTINLDPTSAKHIHDGIYVCRALLPKPFWGVAHIGPRPTYSETERTVEVHCFDFDALLKIPETIYIELYDRLRGITRFESPEAMMQQIEADILQAQSIIRVMNK